MHDSYTDALNAPAGRLAEILLKKIPANRENPELPTEMAERFDRLLSAGGQYGTLARIRLAAEVSFLYDRLPRWTEENILPILAWTSLDASAAWSARKYSNYIGAPALFDLTKDAFLELFNRPDTPIEDLRIFAGWVAAIMVANQSENSKYSLTSIEARSALRRAGVRILPTVAHRLAIELQGAKAEDKLAKWRSVVGPVFQNVWPLDIELQTSASTFNLVQILLASGAAFFEAGKIIIPFIRPDEPNRHSSTYSISNADDILYSSSPQTMLDLLSAVVGENPSRHIFRLGNALARVLVYAPQLADTRKFQRLSGVADNAE